MSGSLLSICEAGVAAALAAGAERAEVYATDAREVQASLEKSDLNLIRVLDETTLGIRVFRDGRSGFATSNRADDLSELAAEALAMAAASPPDPLRDLPEIAPLPPTRSVDPALVELATPEALARMARDLLDGVRARDARVMVDSGELSVKQTERAIASSRGASASFRSTAADAFLFGMALDGAEVGTAGYDMDAAALAEQLAPSLEALLDRFVARCAGALGARRGETFVGPILLPPTCVQSFLLQPLLRSLGADAVRRGTSAMADRVGQPIASPGLSIYEGGAGLPGHPLCPFDREGVPRRRSPLVEAGALRGFLYDSYEARAAGRDPAGHAVGGAASRPSVGAASVEIAAGDAGSAAEMEAAVDRGVVMTRFSGSQDSVSGDFSGVVKGGFLIRDGERVPIRETTVAGNVYECLQQISAISTERRTFMGTLCAPTVRVEGVSITAG